MRFPAFLLGVIALAAPAYADEQPINLYQYTAGYTYQAPVLKRLNAAAALQSETVKLNTVAYDTPGCFVATPVFLSTGSGALGLAVKLRRTYMGPIPNGKELKDMPFVNIQFHRMDTDNEESTESRSIDFDYLQDAMKETTVSQVQDMRFVVATDEGTATYSTIFENVEPFKNGTIALCDVFQGAGFEIDSIHLYVIQ